MITYILQIITIAITLGLGLFSAYQTKKIENGQNIISVTTSYRLKRSEQIKEFSAELLTNTNPELLKASNNDFEILKSAIKAMEGFSSILHRNFKADNDLIELSQKIIDLVFEFKESGDKTELEKKRELFRIKCDIYTSADWNRIKTETQGVNTSSGSWIEYHNEISKQFNDKIDKLN